MPCRLIGLLMITLFATSVSAQSAPAPQLPQLSPGGYSRTFTRQAQPTVRYAISIPANYSPSRPVPLILALHYGGSPIGAGARMLAVLVKPALDELGAIIIAPDSLGGAWNTEDNERAVNDLLEAALNSYNVDKTKVAITGFSMGGAGTWHFAAKYPERFSAAVPVAGRPSTSSGEWRTPVLAIHSRQDEVVPIGPAETRIAELQKAGVKAQMIVVTGITHYETNRFVEPLRKAVPWIREIWNSKR